MSLNKFALAICVVLVASMAYAADDVGQDAAAGTAEAIYYQATGELLFDVGSGVGVVGIGSDTIYSDNVNTGTVFGAPGQNDGKTLAWFSASALPTAEASVGMVLPSGLTADDISFLYTPVGSPTVFAAPMVIGVPEPGTLALLGVLAAVGLCWRRRKS